MNKKYEEGLKLLEEKFGNNRDNIISLATISQEPSIDGNPRPVVRDVDAYYEDGAFYISTWAKSLKMQQIAKNPEVSIAVHFAWFTANGIGENIGWIMDTKNAELRTKLRTAFAKWYDDANNEKDEGCCILAIRLTKGTWNLDHGAKFIHMDFVNKTAIEETSINSSRKND